MIMQPNASAPALEVIDLTVRYGGFVAVNGLNLEVASGAVHGLIGPNGAGKTTSFNAICGYVPAASGQIRVNGQRSKRLSPYRAWHAGIGRTFQRVELFWTLTPREHLELAQRRAAKVDRSSPSPGDLLDLLGVAQVADVTVASLPLGTCRLVEFARAVATGARIIMLDEPCSGLDRKETGQLRESLLSLKSELGLSLLIVEHDVEFILSIADRVAVLDAGRLIAEGTPAEMRVSAEVRAAYLGTDAESEPVTRNHDSVARGAS
jgi:branched-chain amino acid transport system ATP-binding protein